VTDYNKTWEIDLKDQMVQMYLIESKRLRKLYHKLVRRLLNASVLNALIVYRKNCDKPLEHLTFRLLLVEGLFSKYWATGERKKG
jgi:DNA polymerase II large subunit